MISWGLRYFPSSGDRTAVTVIAGPPRSDRREVGRLVLDAGEIEDLRGRLAERQSVAISDVSVMATEYTVCALPPDHRDYRYFAIKVVVNGDRWMVVHGADPGPYLGAAGEWSLRDGTREWWDAHRFDFATALGMAQREAPNVWVNGRTAAEVLSQTEGKR